MTSELIFSVFNAFAFGAAIFLVASGLTLIFGILKILNMAQGSFFMIGAYAAYEMISRLGLSMPSFLAACMGAGIFIAILGFITDRLILARLRSFDYHFVMIATFALMMVCHGIVKIIWGLDYYSVIPPPVLDQPIQLAGMYISRYTLFIIAAGAFVYIALELAIHRLWLGKLMQALATDPWMSGVLGLNVPIGLMFSVMAGFFLAGFSGGLLLPNQSLSPSLGESYLLLAFFAVVIGGLGNIRGAFIASVLLGFVNSLNSVLLPEMPGIAIYVALAAFLLWKPAGLFPSLAQAAETTETQSLAHTPSLIPRSYWQVFGTIVFIAVAAIPLWAGEGILFIAGATLIAGVFALSWNILFGYAGLASFGHAAFFGIGAYLMGATIRYLPEMPFMLTVGAAGLTGAVVAWCVGMLALRRTTGIFLAVLTVALCEALRLLISYSSFLGREDGLSSINRPVIDLGVLSLDLTSSRAYFWFLLVACGLLIAFLWWVAHSRHGRVLLAVRQDPERASFIGIDVKRARVNAFMLSGAVAAIAGALYAPLSRIVTLDEMHWLASTQPVLNSMLGGVSSFWGPLLGSAAFAAITYSMRTMIGLSELIVGGILLAIILVAPDGILGMWRRIERMIFRDPAPSRDLSVAEASVAPATAMENAK